MAAITTWEEIQVRSLQKMFLIESSQIERNDSTNSYLAAMPGAYNEAVQLLSTTNRYITKSHEIECDLTGGYITLDPKEEINDLFRLKTNGIYLTDVATGQSTPFYAYDSFDSLLILPNVPGGKYTIFYYAYPIKVDSTTPDDTDLQLDPDVAALVPLYIASQLFKDDEIQIATVYRNEFEVGRELLVKEPIGNSSGKLHSVTGWW